MQSFRAQDSSEGGKSFDVAEVRADFPILRRKVHQKPLIYFDNAASSQKPIAVLHAVDRFYRESYANVHRGAHHLSEIATAAFEGVRGKVAGFIGASDSKQIVFTRGATEAINLLAHSFGAGFRAGDRVLVSMLEHHSNIVPWQMLAQRCGAVVVPLSVDSSGMLDMDDYRRELARGCRLVAITHVSNALGSLLPVREIIAAAHAAGARVLLDGCQAVPHVEVNVQDLDVDFYVFSAHKIYAPTGSGVLYGKWTLLQDMPPYQGGGEMIESVGFGGSTFRAPPFRFEAGTPPIAQVIGLGAAIDYLSGIDRAAVQAHERNLIRQVLAGLQGVRGIQVYGPDIAHRVGIVSFNVAGAHAHDVGILLDQQGIAVRAGHHCTQPLMAHLGVDATLRASFAMYNTQGEVAAFVEAVEKARTFFA